MSQTTPQPKPMAERIAALHAWYAANVLPVRLTPEAERLWFDFFKQGFNGQDLALVIRYLRGQIRMGKRNEGALRLTNLLARSEEGSLVGFDETLALAKVWKSGGPAKLSALPETEGGRPIPDAGFRMLEAAPSVKGPTAEQIEEMKRNFERLKENL